MNNFPPSTTAPYSSSVQPHRHDLRNAGFFHGNAIKNRCGLHCSLAMGNDDELRGGAHIAHHLSEAVDIGLVERRLDFVEDAERARLVAKESDEQRQGSERLFA